MCNLSAQNHIQMECWECMIQHVSERFITPDSYDSSYWSNAAKLETGTHLFDVMSALFSKRVALRWKTTSYPTPYSNTSPYRPGLNGRYTMYSYLLIIDGRCYGRFKK